jgi:antitoxin ChpS
MATATILDTKDGPALSLSQDAIDALGLRKGSMLEVSIEGSSLLLRLSRRRRPKYTAEELLAQCDFSIPMSDEDREWIDAPRVGRELI